MIQRFNFFDIYGYVIPGAFWLVLLWLPFQLLGVQLPGTAAQITLVGLGASYIAGHLLYRIAGELFPSRRHDGRYLSEKLIDPTDKTLSPPVKTKLTKALLDRFGIDVAVADDRRDTFFLCRAALVQGKMSAYVEQFQGMQVLSRGLAAASLFAIVFYIGWIIAAPFAAPDGAAPLSFSPIALILAIAMILILGRLAMVVDRTVASIILAAVFLLIGLGIGRWHPGLGRPLGLQAYELAVLAGLLTIASSFFKVAADRFDEELAKATYRDFVVLSTKS